jgi:hypothetical protein
MGRKGTTVNLTEGTRRLALLLGVVGALGGCFVSYLEWQEFHSQRTRHDRFEQLAASDVVNRERKSLHSVTEYDAQGNPIQSVVNRNGIKTIVWDKDHVWNDESGIYSIETDDGQTLYPTPAPAAGEYLLVGLFPVAGFIIPWGAIRAIGWVASGFAGKSG